MERFTFRRLCPKQGQPLKDYPTGLRTERKRKFGVFMDEALTTQLVYVIMDNNINIRIRLLSTECLIFDRATTMTLQYEMIDQDSSLLATHTNQFLSMSSTIRQVIDNKPYNYPNKQEA